MTQQRDPEYPGGYFNPGPGEQPPATYTQNYPMPPQVVYVQGNQRETSSMATMSMIFAILGVVTAFCTFGVFSVVAVILAHTAWKETKSGQKGGHGMTVTGMVLGYLMLVPAIFMTFSLMFQ